MKRPIYEVSMKMRGNYVSLCYFATYKDAKFYIDKRGLTNAEIDLIDGKKRLRNVVERI